MEGTSKPSPKYPVLWIRQHEQVEQQVTPPIKILMLTYHNGVKQVVVKMMRLEFVSVREQVILRLKFRKRKEVLVKWNRFKYLSVAETITLIL